MSIERLDNDKGYFPKNCKWATTGEQSRNMRTNRMVTYRGETRPLIEWAERLDIYYHTLRGRLQKGWTTDRALSTPIKRSFK